MKLSREDRLEIKAIYMSVWLDKTASQVDVWHEVICTFLARKQALEISNNTTDKPYND